MAQSVGQIPKPTAVVLASSGTAQRVLTDSGSSQRFVRSVYFRPKADNSGVVYIGDSSVSSSLYVELLDATKDDAMWIIGDQVQDAIGSHFNYVDLYNTWIDGSHTGDTVFVSILALTA